VSATTLDIDGVRLVEDITYGTVSGTELRLDLVLPRSGDGPTPVAIYIHGGGWARGNRRVDLARRVAGVARRGIAVAAIDYRLGPAGRFPAAVHDVHGAIRWLRAHGGEHGLATTRIGAWGSSSGAHLALVAALSRDPTLVGEVGEVGEVGGDQAGGGIDAVVSFFATSDLAARATRSAMERHLLPPGPEHAFLGLDEIDDEGEAIRRARAASPLMMVHADAPPTLLVHGDSDQLVPFSQSRRLHDAIMTAGGRSTLVCLGGAGHEDAAFDQPFVACLVAQFLDDMLASSA
jgi:acetyl esterase/lipase